jgi:ADP-ribosylglycohydrolase
VRVNFRDRVLGCLVGGAIGDAFGSAFEGQSNLTSVLLGDERPWHLTDDTQLTLATCEAILDAGGPAPATIAAHFLKWFRARRLTGLGASTLKALRDLDAGAHWALSGRKGDRGAGNGTAMRIAPLAFCVDPDTDDGRRILRDVCRITHHNDEAWVGALAVAMAIRGTALEHRIPPPDQIAGRLPETSVRERLMEYARLPPSTTLADAAARFGATGFVIESVPFALFAAQHARSLGFTGMLEQVILAGGDTDTNASLAGQIAGAECGFAALPADLLARLPQAEMVTATAERFADFVARLPRPRS